MSGADAGDAHPGEGTISWRSVEREGAERLRRHGCPDPEADARCLLQEATGTEALDYLDILGRPATVRQLARFDAMVERRAAGEPLQYVLGRWAFRRLDLLVDRRVLIPRPETEQVCEVALAEIDRLVAAGEHTYDDRLPVVDLGTGSGAIGLAIAFERPLVDVWLTDVSDDALQVARANLAGIGRAATRVRVAAGSWWAALPDELAGRIGVVVSNPPYVGADEPLPPEVADWEPAGALRSGPDGLDAIRAILGDAGRWLAPDGVAVVELAPQQAEPAVALARRAGFATAVVRDDLAGRPRILVAGRGG